MERGGVREWIETLTSNLNALGSNLLLLLHSLVRFTIYTGMQLPNELTCNQMLFFRAEVDFALRKNRGKRSLVPFFSL